MCPLEAGFSKPGTRGREPFPEFTRQEASAWLAKSHGVLRCLGRTAPGTGWDVRVPSPWGFLIHKGALQSTAPCIPTMTAMVTTVMNVLGATGRQREIQAFQERDLTGSVYSNNSICLERSPVTLGGGYQRTGSPPPTTPASEGPR